MNPVVFEWGPLALRAYAAWLLGGTLAALGLIAWRAYRYDPGAVTRWLDVGLAGLVAGVIGARLMHVGLRWEYFADHADQITRLELGGMSWHGGLLFGAPAVIAAAWIRRVPLRPWTDALALAWPVGMMAAWWGCREVGCGYGYEVNTLADWPGWMVAELPDIYGLVAPRLDLQTGGVVFGAVLLALALLLTWQNWLAGLRLWLILALSGLGLALMSFLRADPGEMWHGQRHDLHFNLILLLLSTVIGSAIWLWDRPSPADGVHGEETKHEDHDRIGPA